MSELPVPLADALAGRRALVFGAVRIELPDTTLRLLDAPGALQPIEGEQYVARDADWGVLDTIKGLADNGSDSVQSVTIGMIPSGALGLDAMLDPALQGSPVRVLIGAADMATGAVFGTYDLFTGEVDVPTPTWNANDIRVEFKCSGIGERLFAVEEGKRLSDAHHQSVWPGELGLAFVTGVENWVPWGQNLKTSQLQVRTDRAGIYTSTGFTLSGNSGGGSFGGQVWWS